MKKFCALSLQILLVYIVVAEDEPRVQFDWNACVELAIYNNRDLKAARFDIAASEENVISARSGLLPQAKLSGSVRRSDGTDEERYGASISASQLIYDGGRTWDEWQKRKIEAATSSTDYQIESANVRYKLRMAYVNLLKAQKMADIWQTILKRRKESRRLVNLRYQAGREHRGALLTAEAREMEAEVEVQQAARSMELAKSELLNIIGIVSGIKNFSLKNEDFSLSAEKTAEPPFADIATQTPSLRKQYDLKKIAEINLQQAKRSRLPSVQLSAETGISGVWPPEEESWSVGIGLSLPIFEGWKKTADIRSAEAELTATVERYQRELEKNVQTMKQKWTEYLNASERVGVREKYRNAAQERAKIAEVQYSSGLLSFDNWIIIENEFVDAERAFISAQAEAMSAEAAWHNIIGRTLEHEKSK